MTSPAKQRLSLAGIGRVLFCAVAGALVCSVLLVFLEGFRWIDSSSESGGFVHNFFWISLLVVNQMFLTKHSRHWANRFRLALCYSAMPPCSS